MAFIWIKIKFSVNCAKWQQTGCSGGLFSMAGRVKKRNGGPRRAARTVRRTGLDHAPSGLA